jgi:hypothetical protein
MPVADRTVSEEIPMNSATLSPVFSTAVVEPLRQALAAERAVADLLTAEPVQLASGPYPRLLAGEAKRARHRIDDLDDRLATITGAEGTLAATAETVRRLAGDAWEVSTTTMAGGLELVRRPPVEPALVEHAHRLAAAVAVAHTAQLTLAEIARAEGDSATAEFATLCRREQAALRTSIDDAVPTLVASMQEARTRPTYRDTTTAVTTRVRHAAEHLGHDARHAPSDLRDAVTRLWRRGRRTTSAQPGKPATTKAAAETAAEGKAADPPIDDYTRLTAAQIVDKLPNLTADELAAVERYERAHAARITVLHKIEALHENRGQA